MSIYSIIVSYQPDIKTLKALCDNLSNYGSKVIVVDNSELSPIPDIENCSIIRLGTNKGVAYAQNTGIRSALTAGAEVVVFFDQDSIIDSEFVKRLVKPIEDGKASVTGSVFFDALKGFEFPSYGLNRLGLPFKIFSAGKTNIYPVDIIISSGSAMQASVFDAIGMMDEDFFIDYIDIEWCLRCKKNRIPIYIVPDAIMRHSIGEKSIDFGGFRGFVHSPVRSYYKVRNVFLLFRKPSVPFLYSFREILVVLLHHLLQLMLVNRKKSYFKYFWFSIRDGIKGVKGKGLS